MVTPRAYPGLAAMPDGRLYLFGGFNGSGSAPVTNVPAATIFQHTMDKTVVMPARALFCISSLSLYFTLSFFLAVIHVALPTAALGDMYIYDPTINKWTQLATSGSAPSSRKSPAFAAGLDGMLYLYGGLSGSTVTGCSVVPTALTSTTAICSVEHCLQIR